MATAAACLSLFTPVPWFRASRRTGSTLTLHTLAGHYVAIAFVAEDADHRAVRALAECGAFDGRTAWLIVATRRPNDAALPRDRAGVAVVDDADGAIAEIYGGSKGAWALVDPTLRLLAHGLLADHGLADRFASLGSPERHAHRATPPPILIVPRVFEPDLCDRLIRVFTNGAPKESGFMREIDGRTKLVHDPNHKRRRDVLIDDARLQAACKSRLVQRLLPEISKAFQFTATRIERFLVARYAGDEAGHFGPHRDNTTKGTAHRRFAVTIALDDGFEGGGVRFPEYSFEAFRPPVGGALVFSCGLLHEALPIRVGVRTVFLPFLFDEAGARLRKENLAFVDQSAQVSGSPR